MNTLLGASLPATHYKIVVWLERYWFAIRGKIHFSIEEVPSHVGVPGNEMADKMLRAGIHSLGRLGRFSRFPSQLSACLATNLDLTNCVHVAQ